MQFDKEKRIEFSTGRYLNKESNNPLMLEIDVWPGREVEGLSNISSTTTPSLHNPNLIGQIIAFVAKSSVIGQFI